MVVNAKVYVFVVGFVSFIAAVFLILSSYSNSVFSNQITANAVEDFKHQDVFRSDENFFNLISSNEGNLKFEIDEPGRVVWKTAHIINKDSGETLELTATGSSLNDNWVVGTATFEDSLDYHDFQGGNIILTYSCVLINNEWKCGCNSEVCDESSWFYEEVFVTNMSFNLVDCDSASEVGHKKCIGDNLYQCIGDFGENLFRWYPVSFCNDCLPDDDGWNASCDSLKRCSREGFSCFDYTVFNCWEDDFQQSYPYNFLLGGECAVPEESSRIIDSDICTLGENYCIGNSLFECKSVDNNEFLYLKSYCEAGCYEGECLEECMPVDDCNEASEVGNKKCSDNDDVLECTNSSGCIQWTINQTCSLSAVCSDTSKTCECSSGTFEVDGACCPTADDCFSNGQCYDSGSLQNQKLCSNNDWLTCDESIQCSDIEGYQCYLDNINWLWSTNNNDYQTYCDSICQPSTDCDSVSEVGHKKCSDEGVLECKQSGTCIEWKLIEECSNFLKCDPVNFDCYCDADDYQTKLINTSYIAGSSWLTDFINTGEQGCCYYGNKCYVDGSCLDTFETHNSWLCSYYHTSIPCGTSSMCSQSVLYACDDDHKCSFKDGKYCFNDGSDWVWVDEKPPICEERCDEDADCKDPLPICNRISRKCVAESIYDSDCELPGSLGGAFINNKIYLMNQTSLNIYQDCSIIKSTKVPFETLKLEFNDDLIAVLGKDTTTNDFEIFYFDYQGNVLLNISLTNDYPYSVNPKMSLTNNALYFVVGSSSSTYDDVKIQKYSLSGNKIWNLTVGSDENIKLSAIKSNNNQNLVLAYYSLFEEGIYNDYLYFINFNDEGTVVWEKELQIYSYEIPIGFDFFTDGTFAVLTHTNSNQFLLLFDSEATLINRINLAPYEYQHSYVPLFLEIDDEDNVYYQSHIMSELVDLDIMTFFGEQCGSYKNIQFLDDALFITGKYSNPGCTAIYPLS